MTAVKTVSHVPVKGEYWEEDIGIYVYCILSRQDNVKLVDRMLLGIDNRFPIYTVPYENLTAVVSRVSLTEFNPERIHEKIEAEELQWIDRRVRAHEEKIELLMQDHNLLPMNFCTIFKSEARVKEMVKDNYEKFINILNKLFGKMEIEVKIFCKKENLKNYIKSADEKSNTPEKKSDIKSPGLAYILKKKQEYAGEEKMVAHIGEVTQTSYWKLEAVAEDACLNKIIEKKSGDRELVLRAAFLVEKKELIGFLDQLKRLQKRHEPDGFTFEDRAWPPNSFAII